MQNQKLVQQHTRNTNTCSIMRVRAAMCVPNSFLGKINKYSLPSSAFYRTKHPIVRL
jgi:hypothetical protein